ncbi:hypothetical protein Tco_1557471, partial [Tanacetum coccineum]
TTTPRGGRTGGRIGRGGGSTGEPTSRVGGRTGDQGGQGGDRGIRANGGDDEVPDFSTVIAQQLQDLLPTIIAQEFMACNPKDYDGKGGAIVYNRWIEKMKSVQDMSGCRANQKVKYTTDSFIGKALMWWNTQVQTRGREAAVGMTWKDLKDLLRKELCPNKEMQKLETKLVPHLVILENKRIERYIYGLALQICVLVAATKPTTIQSVVLKAGMLTDEAIRNGSLKKNTKKRGNSEELNRKENVRDDNKRSRTGRVFATIINPVRKEYMGTAPECTNCNFHHNPEMPCRKCTNYNRLGNFARDCRTWPRMVTPVKPSTKTRRKLSKPNYWEVKVVETMAIKHVEEHS